MITAKKELADYKASVDATIKDAQLRQAATDDKMVATTKTVDDSQSVIDALLKYVIYQ